MVYAFQVKVIQFLTIGIQFLCLVLASLCTNADRHWNDNSFHRGQVDRVDLLHEKYRWPKAFNFEEQLLIEKRLGREVAFQVGALLIFAILITVSIVHCYLCFILTFLFYRKYLNIYFHIVGAMVLLGGLVCYLISFVWNNESYDTHFAILYEGIPVEKVPFHPCKFPSTGSGFGELFSGQPYACQESWTKFFVIFLTFTNVLLYLSAAFVVGFFIEEEDAAEMLYKQMEIVDGGPLTSLDKLPPLPYYARPLADSPTANKGIRLPRNYIRVEVPQNWTSGPKS